MRTILLVLGSFALAGSSVAQPPAPPPAPKPAVPVSPKPRVTPVLPVPRPFEFSPEWIEELQRAALERTHELQWELQGKQWDLQSRQWELQAKLAEELQHAALERTHELQWELHDQLSHIGPEIEAKLAPLAPLAPGPWPLAPGPWPLVPEQGTPEDSLYRVARESLNRGDYARAASLFQSFEQRYPRSRVAPAALYYQAFALYRSGSTDHLRNALSALRTRQEKYPDAAADPNAATLRTRVYAALAARGDAQAAAAVRAASTAGTGCDKEEMDVRAEALSALTQLDPENAAAALKRVLARRDECSVPLRRRAVYLLGRAGTEAATNDLLEAARVDPDASVRSDAISILGRSSFATVTPQRLLLLFNDNPDQRTRQAVLSALRSRGDADSRRALRAIIERGDVPERLRAQAISNLAGSSFAYVEVAAAREAAAARDALVTAEAARARAGVTRPVVAARARTSESGLTDEDAAFLRNLYGRTDSRTIKSAILSALGRTGGPTNDQWLLTLIRNPAEESSLRREALSRLKSSAVSIEDLGRLYDGLAERELRLAVVSQLSSREEPGAVDKLIDIAKTSTDPRVRSQAIQALTRKKDPKATAFIREFVEKP